MPSQWLRRLYRVSAEPPPASTDVLNALPPRDEHASPWNAMPTTLSTMPSTTCLSLAARDHSPQLSVRFSQATLDQSSHQPAASTSPIQSPSPSPSPIPSPSSGVEYPGQVESARQTGSQKPGDSPGPVILMKSQVESQTGSQRPGDSPAPVILMKRQWSFARSAMCAGSLVLRAAAGVPPASRDASGEGIHAAASAHPSARRRSSGDRSSRDRSSRDRSSASGDGDGAPPSSSAGTLPPSLTAQPDAPEQPCPGSHEAGAPLIAGACPPSAVPTAPPPSPRESRPVRKVTAPTNGAKALLAPPSLATRHRQQLVGRNLTVCLAPRKVA